MKPDAVLRCQDIKRVTYFCGENKRLFYFFKVDVPKVRVIESPKLFLSKALAVTEKVYVLAKL
jgi:hypothetical protein